MKCRESDSRKKKKRFAGKQTHALIIFPVIVQVSAPESTICRRFINVILPLTVDNNDRLD